MELFGIFGLQLEMKNFYLLNSGIFKYFTAAGKGSGFKSDSIHRLDTFPGQLV